MKSKESKKIFPFTFTKEDREAQIKILLRDLNKQGASRNGREYTSAYLAHLFWENNKRRA